MSERNPPADAPFDLAATALETDSSVVFALDRELLIRYCNRAWDEFAAANGGSHLLRASILGRPVLDFISGPLEDYYRDACRRVLERDAPWLHHYECSSADVFRSFAMHVYPIDGGAGLLFINSLHVQEPHTMPGRLALEAAYQCRDGIVVMCANCRRTRRCGERNDWDWAPGFVSNPPAQVSHGLCPPCAERYFLALKD